MRELNKVDRPSKLLLWFEYGRDSLSVRKIKEEGFVTVGVEGELARIRKLPSRDQQKALAQLPYEIEKRIARELDVRGSLPYEIREWVSSVMLSKALPTAQEKTPAHEPNRRARHV